MNKHHTYVNLCESGERQLNIIELREWCQALGISWVEFTREIDALLEAQETPSNEDLPSG